MRPGEAREVARCDHKDGWVVVEERTSCRQMRLPPGEVELICKAEVRSHEAV